MTSRAEAPRPQRKRRKATALPIIGWREWVALPELRVEIIKAKVDTGARSSALHAFEITEFERQGRLWVRFQLHPLQRSSELVIHAESPMLARRWVRSSTGRKTLRPVIKTPITLGQHTWPIEITLVRRDMMGFRMLLGRQAISKRFLVHCGRSYLARQSDVQDPPLPRGAR